ncbi:MAG: hypothetical protein RI958_3009 [Actinomycetota bacterium]
MSDPSLVLREPDQVVSLSATGWLWDEHAVDHQTTPGFVEALADLGVTLIVSREYEHFVMALSADERGLAVSVARLPHPSGIVVDRALHQVHIACTRNPNQVITYGVSPGCIERDDVPSPLSSPPALAPISTRFLPGSMYLHDLAFVDGRLVGNAVGMNAIVDLGQSGPDLVWWPSSIEDDGIARHGRNLLQLNSIAAGPTLAESYFTASTEAPGPRLPGDPLWEVDRNGVIFRGDQTVVARGLTRPHSARLAGDGSLWVDDSGYGRLCRVDDTGLDTVAAFDGWTRGLCMIGDMAIVGTSRVLPRFRAYAPGLDAAQSRCGLHVVDLRTGTVVGSSWFPNGDQIFAIDWLPSSITRDFVGGATRPDPETTTAAWYSYRPPETPMNPPHTHQRETPR